MRTQAESGGISELRRWSWESGETKAANLCRVSTQSTIEENVTKGKSPESSGKYQSVHVYE